MNWTLYWIHLQALRDRYYSYLRERHETLLDQFNTSPMTCVYLRSRTLDT